ncbi:MAG: undecaprenyl-diphosphate phosphatase [Moraxellaceae bacterium]|nr:undecaprenyl-diphosphate phosphatase [Moraxellaceae bacterium]
MDIILLLKAVLMGLIEGATEFLPVSSTGHLIVTASLINFWTPEKRHVFEVAIQLGAILAVCYQYRQRLINVTQGLFTGQAAAWTFATNILIAFMPAAMIGLFARDFIKAYLFNPVSVAIALVIGGFIILYAEKRQHQVTVPEVDDMKPLDALKLGLAQCCALIPGTSRSGATIIGGLFFGLSRKAAAEFSFFLAIPTMVAATFYDVYKSRDAFVLADFPVFAVGFIAAFIAGLIVVRTLVVYVSNHSFAVFGYYRIVFGCFILATAWFGLIDWSH